MGARAKEAGTKAMVASDAMKRMEELRSKGTRRPVPRSLRRLTDAGFTEHGMEQGVRRGQLWLAKDQTSRMEYVIVESCGDDPRILTVMPMSDDPGMAMPGVPSVDAEGSPLEVALFPMPQLRSDVPSRLLCRPLGELGEDVVGAIERGVAARTVPVPEESGLWMDDPMSLAGYETTKATMEDWHALCDRLPALSTQDDDASPFDEHGARLYDMLIDVLGLTVGQANDVYDGRRPLDDRQKRMLIGAGARPQDLDFVFELPADLLIEVEQPLWRSEADAFALTHDGDPRLGLARECYALHARTKGTWRDRLGKLRV